MLFVSIPLCAKISESEFIAQCATQEQYFAKLNSACNLIASSIELSDIWKAVKDNQRADAGGWGKFYCS